MDDLPNIEPDQHKTLDLQGGPLDGQTVTVPGPTIALIVFHDAGFHRYSLAAGGGQVGQEAPLGYTGPVAPETAGFRERGESG